MKIITKCCALIGAAAVLTSANALATIDGTVTYLSRGSGGVANTGFIIKTSGLGTYHSFCLEEDEYFQYNTPYSYSLNSGAVEGGISTFPTGTSTFDPICIGTAYLFSQFHSGAIADDLNNSSAMQNAIWYLESEIGSLSVGGNTLVTSALSALIGLGLLNDGSTIDDMKASDANGAFGVTVLNIYDRNGVKQDQLGVVPEPSTVIAGALLLLPFGVSAVRILRKSKQA